MPTVNLAVKYSSKIDEVMREAAGTDIAVNQDYDFVGVKTVKVYSIPTVAMNDYTRSGSNRYGTPAELEDALQEMTLSKDRAFSFTIDKGNEIDSPDGVRAAGAALQRQINLVVAPEIDTYRRCVMALNAGHKKYEEITSSNAYDAFIDANTQISESKMPVNGRIAFVTPTFLKLLKKDTNFVKASDIGQEMLVKGQIGAVDGVAIIMAPASEMPAGAAFIITNKIATVGPVKMAEYKIHQDPPGLSGNLVEGRVYYDAFVLNNKADMIAAHFTSGTLTAEMTASTTSGKGVVTVKGVVNGAKKIVYKTGASQAAATIGADLSSGWTEIPSDGVISATATHKLAVAAVDEDNIAIATAAVITVAVGS